MSAPVGSTLALIDCVAPFLNEDERVVLSHHRRALVDPGEYEQIWGGKIRSLTDAHPLPPPILILVRRVLLDRQPSVAHLDPLTCDEIALALDRIRRKGYVALTVRVLERFFFRSSWEPPRLRGEPEPDLGADAPPPGYCLAAPRIWTALAMPEATLCEYGFTVTVTSRHRFDLVRFRLVLGVIRDQAVQEWLVQPEPAAPGTDGGTVAVLRAPNLEIWRTERSFYHLRTVLYRADGRADEKSLSADDPIEIRVERNVVVASPAVLCRLVAGGFAVPVDRSVFAAITVVQGRPRWTDWKSRHSPVTIVLSAYGKDPTVHRHQARPGLFTRLYRSLYRHAFPEVSELMFDPLYLPLPPPLGPLEFENGNAVDLLQRLHFHRFDRQICLCTAGVDLDTLEAMIGTVLGQPLRTDLDAEKVEGARAVLEAYSTLPIVWEDTASA